MRLAIASIVCLALVACGDDAPPPADRPEPLEVAFRLVFKIDIERAVTSGRIPANTSAEDLLAETVRVTQARVTAFGVSPARVVRPLEGGDTRFEVLLPKMEPRSIDDISDAIMQLGQLTLRIQVRPDPPTIREATRPSLWKAAFGDFETWKAAEVKRWQKHRDEGRVYTALDPATSSDALGLYVAKRAGTDGTDVSHFVVLETPVAAHRFDASLFENPRVSKDMNHGFPVVVVDIREDRQKAFGEWTEQNIGHPMAMLRNGEMLGEGDAPIIMSKLTENLQITLGSVSIGEAERRARILSATLASGALRVRPQLVAKEDLLKPEPK